MEIQQRSSPKVFPDDVWIPSNLISVGQRHHWSPSQTAWIGVSQHCSFLLNLTAAFDMVNFNLLTQRLTNTGIQRTAFQDNLFCSQLRTDGDIRGEDLGTLPGSKVAGMNKITSSY